LDLGDWKEGEDFAGTATHSIDHPGFILFTIPDLHLHHDNIDRELEKWLERSPKEVIFLSRHSAASGKRTLTVHPIGNYGDAQYGGRPSTMVPSSPHLMGQAHKKLSEVATNSSLRYDVSYEVTHHGPYLETPTFFIEIGSTEDAWRDQRAAEAIAQTLLALDPDGGQDFPVAIGVGGGHYAPRFNDVARKKRIAFGHMVPNYALDHLSSEVIDMLIERTPDVKLVYFHRKSMPKPKFKELVQSFQEKGLQVVREADLEDLD